MDSPPDESRSSQAIGRSRGGLTSKITVLTDRRGRFARFSLKPGNAYEGGELIPLLDSVPIPGQLLADKAYDSRAIRDSLANSGTEAVIPRKRQPLRKSSPPPGCDMKAYKARHLVENAFADLKQFRGIATRYCKLAETFSELLSLVFWHLNTKEGRRGPSPHSR